MQISNPHPIVDFFKMKNYYYLESKVKIVESPSEIPEEHINTKNQ